MTLAQTEPMPLWHLDFADQDQAIAVMRPVDWTSAVIFSSPHSGRDYPASFLSASRLDALAVRRSEDSFLDELYAAAPAFGAPLLKALFPRAYCDPNREAYEWDPSLFEGPLPTHVRTNTPRVLSGFGTIATLVANGARIYQSSISIEEAEQRIARCWRPYHAALADLIRHARDRFGAAILIDCHSMPSVGGPMEQDKGESRLDFVLGDAHGTSCHADLTNIAQAFLEKLGYTVGRNYPYAGGHITTHYGQPRRGVHGLQIEINRGLYMDEEQITRTDGFNRLKTALTALIAELTAIDPRRLEA